MANYTDVYLTPDQVAERLQVDPESVRRWLRAKKLRGSRISPKAWRVSERDLMAFVKRDFPALVNGQNISEFFFEKYVAENQLGIPERHPAFPGATRLVDYRLVHGGKALWFEVKEFAGDKQLIAGKKGGAFDPYLGIRAKIDKAREKFRDYPEECCNLVLFNEEFNLVHISAPDIVLGAMLGNVGFSVPINPETGNQVGSTTKIFIAGGKLVHPHLKTPQKTRLSSIIALGRFPVGQKEFRIKVEKTERDEGRNLPLDEMHEIMESDRIAYERVVLRVVTYESPYADKQLPRDIFTGPFDERWGPSGDVIGPIFTGAQLKELRQAEHELELDDKVARLLQRRARRSLSPVTQVREKPNFAEFLRNSPLAGSGLEFERIKDHPRQIEL